MFSTSSTTGLIPALALLAASACGDGSEEAAWEVVHRDLESALMAVWVGAPDNVWAVGADTGTGPAILHFDGTGWESVASGLTGDLWWVFGFDGGPVYVGGEQGLIARYDRSDFVQLETPTAATVFGIWGASPAELWAVGGNLGGANGAFAWRLDGDRWVPAPGFPEELVDSDAVWKVFGRSADDVWLVGTNGLVLHHDGANFVREDAGVSVPLFTVHGTVERLYAVGGFATGVLLERDAAGWHNATPEGAGSLVGVYAAAGDAYAVGADSAVYRRNAGGSWVREQTDTATYQTLHAVGVDSEAGVWAVGGQLQLAPYVRGLLLHKGEPLAATSDGE